MLDADGLPVVEHESKPVEPAGPTICEKCGKELEVGEWPWCPHGREIRGGWHFAQGQNEARKEAFFKRRAADPFGEDD